VEVASNVGNNMKGVAFDGTRIWTANEGKDSFCPQSSLSIVTPGNTIPWSVTNITTGFNRPYGMLFDGSNIWVTDKGDNTVKKLNSTGGVIQSIPVGSSPRNPIFDGMNIWIPNFDSNNITVVRVKGPSGNPITAFVLATVSAPLMSGPETAAFDGERVLITCHDTINALYLFKAADLSFIAAVATGDGTVPLGACSDGINFWVTLNGTEQLMRF
jgi:streptogramin lyase